MKLYQNKHKIYYIERGQKKKEKATVNTKLTISREEKKEKATVLLAEDRRQFCNRSFHEA